MNVTVTDKKITNKRNLIEIPLSKQITPRQYHIYNLQSSIVAISIKREIVIAES